MFTLQNKIIMTKKVLFSTRLKQLVAVILLLTASVVNAQVPTITSFSPRTSEVGASVTITGTNFDATPANNIVYFGSVKATVTAATTTSLTVTVPAGAKTASLNVINLSSNLSAKSTLSFNLRFVNSNPSTITSSHFSAFQLTSSTTPAAVQSGSWSSVRHNGAVADIDGDGKVDLLKVDNSGYLILAQPKAC